MEGIEGVSTTYRRAEESDIPLLLKFDEGAAETGWYIPTLSQEAWEEELKSDVVHMIVRGSSVVGYIAYKEKESRHIYITGVVVGSEFLRQGIARQAVQWLLTEHSSASRIDLVTNPNNPARKLYEALGFEQEGEVMEAHFGEGEDRIRMVYKKPETSPLGA